MADTSTSGPGIELITGKGRGAYARAQPVGRSEGPCELCGGSGRELIEREGVPVVRSCACQAAEIGCRLFNAAQIPRILGDCGIEQAPVGGQERFFLPQSVPQRNALEAVRRFVETYPEERGSGRGFLLMGRPGTGKSHLLCGTLRELTLRHHIPCRYVEFFHLLSELKEGFSQGKSELEIIAPLSEIEVLAVDELGKGRGSEWELYVMDEIISRRYNAGKATLFASNYTLDRASTLPERADRRGKMVRTGTAGDAERLTAETLEERVGVRIYSRLYEMCDLVDMGPSTPDYRREKKG